MLPILAAVFGVSVDALLGYKTQKLKTTAYEEKYKNEEYFWRSGELFSYYWDWKFEKMEEVIFECNSSGIPHKHCMEVLLARKPHIL